MNSKAHLNEDLIVKAAIDKKDLPPEARSHLSGCAECRLKLEELEGDLYSFTSITEKLMPAPQKTIRLSVEDRNSIKFGWKAPAFAGLLIIMITLGTLPFLMPEGEVQITVKSFTIAQLEEEMASDRLLVAGVMELEENIMPEIYNLLAGDTDSDQYDEFIDFVLPMEENINGV